MFGGSPTPTRPATYLTSGAECRISRSRNRGSAVSLNSTHSALIAASTASLSGTVSTTSSTGSSAAVTARSSSATSVAPAAAVAAGSRSGVRPVICRPQSFDGHLGVYLGCCERSVTKQFLDGSQVSSPLQQVRRGAVPQAVRPEVG